MNCDPLFPFSCALCQSKTASALLFISPCQGNWGVATTRNAQSRLILLATLLPHSTICRGKPSKTACIGCTLLVLSSGSWKFGFMGIRLLQCKMYSAVEINRCRGELRGQGFLVLLLFFKSSRVSKPLRMILQS